MFRTNPLNRFFRAIARRPRVTLPTDPNAPAGTEMIVDSILPPHFAIPQDIIYEIVDRLVNVPYPVASLRSSSLVSKSWVTPSRRHLFRAVWFGPNDTFKWIQTFPVQDRSPAHHVKHLYLLLRGSYALPEEFFRRIQWFTNVEYICMSTCGHPRESWWLPSFARLPQTVTSLSVDGGQITVLQIRDLMVQLPNLNDLSLSDPFRKAEGNKLQGIGTVLKGKFGGQLDLRRLGRRSSADVVNMLCEVPTGLHFTEVHIVSEGECLSIMKLANACKKSLVKLSYTVHDHGNREPVDRPLDFTRLPNLEVVILDIYWTAGSLHWISTALSTLKPATSPHLYAVQLKLTEGFQRSPLGELEQFIGDLILIRNGATRIKREFGGKVDVTMSQYMHHYSQPHVPL